MKKLSSLYLHFPFCKHLCNYCDFYKTLSTDRLEHQKFEKLLEESFHRHQIFLKEYGYSWGPLETVYLGGGTPSLWGEAGAAYLSSFFKKNSLELSKNCEFTLELNPGTWKDTYIDAWESTGVNRYSVGVQSLRDNFLKALDRVHNSDDVHKTLQGLQKRKASFSVDFMLGIPNSHEWSRDIIGELKEILDYGPTHLSLYILTVKDHYIRFKDLPTENFISDEYLAVSQFLKGRGFEHYEVSNFALKGKSSKHNLNYWKSSSVAALGPSATGFLREVGIRYKWKVSEADFVIEKLGKEELDLEDLYMNLRTSKGIRPRDFFKGDDLPNFRVLAEKWKTRGLLIKCCDESVILNSSGYLLLDSLLGDIFGL